MKHWYISPIIGNGTRDNPYRLKLADHVNAGPEGSAYAAVIPSKPDGHPLYDWGLAIVMLDDHAGLVADSELTAIPTIGLDESVNRITAQERAALVTTLAAKQVPVNLNAPGLKIRDVVRAIGQKLDPGFDESRLDVNK